MKKIFIATAQYIFSGVIIGKVLITNVNKIKNANRIFINSQGFGHSVIDTIAYLEHFGPKSIVISLGTSMGQNPGTERNYYFEYYFDKYAIIPLNVPTFFLRKENWRFIHPITKIILKSICYIIRNNQTVIDEYNERINFEILPKRIANHLQISIENSKDILADMTKSFKLAETQHQSYHTIHFLFEQPLRDIGILDKFLDDSVSKIANDTFDQNLFVCLAIRRGNAPYHSTADYYLSVVELLFSQGFKVYLLGDRDYFLKSVQVENIYLRQGIINFDINKYDSKLLDIYAISKCAFVLGDQGGVWSLVSAFNKPGLIINGSCVGHLQFNVESLPRKWIYESNKLEFVDARILFNNMFYRYKPAILTNDGSKIIQAENDLSLILRVVDRYTSNTEFKTKRGMDKMILCNFPDNKQIQLAKNSSYSPDYIDKLVF
jgi:putative glycosyltransferase (TIGR04372 family)